MTLSFAGLMGCLSLYLYRYLVSPSQEPRYLLALTVLLAVALGVHVALLRSRSREAIPPGWSRWGGGAVALALLGSLSHLLVGSALQHPLVMLVLVVGVVALLAATFLDQPLILSWLAVVFSVLLGVCFTLIVPFEESAGDMLELVEVAVSRFLDGQFPYQDLRIAGSSELDYSARPVPYPPLLWLTFVPFQALGLDLRWVPILATALTGLILLRTARRSGQDRLAWFLLASSFLAPIFILRMPTIQTPPFWLVLCLLALSANDGERPFGSGVIAGVALGMRETSVILIPLLVLRFLRRGPSAAVTFLSGLALVTLLVYLPFLIVDPEAFVSSLVYNALYVVQLERPLTHIGFGPWLANAASPRLATVAAAAALLTVYAVSWRSELRRGSLPIQMGVAYLFFMLFNPLIHEYYYFPGLLLIALGLLHEPRREAAHPR